MKYKWKPHYNHLSKKTLKEIVKKGREGFGVVNIKYKYKISTKTIKKIYQDFNIDPFKAMYSKDWDTKFFMRENKKTAYWAGFLVADGYIGKSNRLEFTQKNKEVVEKYCEDLKIDKKKIIKRFNRYRSKGRIKSGEGYRVLVSAYKLNEDLLRWGIGFRKSYIFYKPIVSKKLLPHYLRGWFDGDGSISVFYHKRRSIKNVNKIPNFQFALTGTKDSVLWFKKKIIECGYNFKKGINVYKKKNTIAHTIRVTSSNVQYLLKFAEILKVDNNYHFKEKWSNYFQFKDFEKIGLKIIKKSISKLKYNKNKGITSEEIFNKAIKILKINNDKYPLTKRRVELSMVKIGLKSEVFNLNGKRLRRWFLK